MTPQDWTLLTIAAADGDALRPVQLQKALFLISRNVPTRLRKTRSFYGFVAYDYGPFCKQVYTDAEILELTGLVQITRPPTTRYQEFRATAAGLRRAESIREKLSAPADEYLQNVVDFVRTVSFNELVNAIYNAYPEMRENSVFSQGQ